MERKIQQKKILEHVYSNSNGSSQGINNYNEKGNNSMVNVNQYSSNLQKNGPIGSSSLPPAMDRQSASY
jgi:hypothetical protein